MKIRSLFAKVSAILCVAVLATTPSLAEAGWGSVGGSWGGASYGSYGGGGSGGYAVSYGSGGSYGSYGSYGGGTGPVRRLLAHIGQKIHNHHAARRAYYGSYGGSYGGYVANYGSSGGYSAAYSHGSSGGAYYSSYSGGSSGGVVTSGYGSAGYGAVETSYGSVGTSFGSAGGTYHGASTDTTNDLVGSLVSTAVEVDYSAMLTVAVPSSAKIFVNDNPTTSVGGVRQFVSRGLEPGRTYQFKVRAEFEDAKGKIVSDVKTVAMTAGQRETLEFNLVSAATPVETAVTLRVPEGATVVLAGNETNAVGATRTFRTQQLVAGHVWDDYTIQVKLGDEVKEQKVRLIAGDRLELAFDFGASTDRLASR